MRKKIPERHWRVLAQANDGTPPVTVGWSVNEESARLAVKMLNETLVLTGVLPVLLPLVWCEDYNTDSTVDHERWTICMEDVQEVEAS